MSIFSRHLFVLLLLVLIAASSPAQYNNATSPGSGTNRAKGNVHTNKLAFELAAHYGFFIANQPKSLYLSEQHSRFIEFAISRQTTGSKQWERENHLPIYGLALSYGNPGSSYFGKVAVLSPFIHFPLLRKKNSITTFRLGTGIGFVEKPFDKNSNFKNLMIGSHINAAITLKLQQEWHLGEHISGNLGLGFTHLSNGRMHLPNLGLNIPAFSVGIKYHHNQGEPEEQHYDQPDGYLAAPPKPANRPHVSKRINVLLMGSIALKETYPLEQRHSTVGILTGEASVKLSPISSLTTGLTIAYDPALSRELMGTDTYEFDKSELQLQASVFAGYEHHIGRISVPVQLGIYVYNNYPSSALYQLIGLRYRWADRWIGGIHLKAHFGKADYIQVGIAYKLI